VPSTAAHSTGHRRPGFATAGLAGRLVGTRLTLDEVDMSAAFLPIILVPLALAAQFAFARRFDWRCPNCGHTFSLSPVAAALLPHTFGGRKLARCPDCGVRSWVSPVPKA
jgi:DNA-directed RNA polymerase subunit RPC12/RpoP